MNSEAESRLNEGATSSFSGELRNTTRLNIANEQSTTGPFSLYSLLNDRIVDLIVSLTSRGASAFVETATIATLPLPLPITVAGAV